ncbi:hypothetical protein BDN71DRAFT_1344224, partial [Pleurotus eryngii]
HPPTWFHLGSNQRCGESSGARARHESIQRNRAADLQVGERYANMYYTFAFLLQHHRPELPFVVSYDITCQWSKSIIAHLKTLLLMVWLHLTAEMVLFAVPKLCMCSYMRHCQQNYLLNYLPEVERMDGEEGIEQLWVNIGVTA